MVREKIGFNKIRVISKKSLLFFTDDSFLSAIVRASKGRLQKTKLYLENLNALGLKYPEFCASYDPLDPQLQESLTAW